MTGSEPQEAKASIAPAKRDDSQLEDVPALVTRYINQLVVGCGSSECKAILCRDGIRNTSRGKPVRKHTTRSARTIAVAIVATPNPRRYLCSMLTDRSARARAIVGETRKPPDQSALDQLLSETKSLKLFGDLNIPCSHDEALKTRHVRLNELLKAATLPAEDSLSDTELVNEIVPCLDWLLAKTPCESIESFIYANKIISKGSAYPSKIASKSEANPSGDWLAMLDTLHHKPYLRLLGRIVQVLATRHRLPAKSRDDILTQPSIHKLLVERLLVDQGTTGKARALLIWLKRLILEHWDGQPSVRIGSICHGAWDTLHVLRYHDCSQELSLESALFTTPMILVRLSAVELVQSFSSGDARRFHLLNYTFLFDMRPLILFFRVSNHLTMRSAHSKVYSAMYMKGRYEQTINDLDHSEQSRYATKNYLLLSVSRKNILQDTFDQLWQRRKDELKRPLRIRLGEVDEHEMGQDLGGVQIEFFNLVVKQLFREEAQMFVTDPQTALSYFKPGSLQPLHMFEMFGLLMALALHNGITLPINMPRAFYGLIFSPNHEGGQKAIDYIRSDWPVLAKSMQSVLDEEVSDLDLTFPFEANGIHMEVLHPLLVGRRAFDPDRSGERHVLRVTSTMPQTDPDSISEELPGWKLLKAKQPPSAIPTEIEGILALYVTMYIRWILYTSVAPQWEAFKRGFLDSGILNPAHMQTLFSPLELKSVVEGTTHLDIDWLRNITQYDGFNRKDPYIQQFWKIVTSWPEAKQKQLVKFVTAAERIPITGKLTFIVQKHETENLERLPTSSTCFGTLSLPVYGSERILAAKLGLALELGTEGFGVG